MTPITIQRQEEKGHSGKTAARLLTALTKYITVPKEGTTYRTHGIHPYPAKFIPQIPARIILDCSNERHTILDPFCGSGTTLLEARLNGRDSIGFDTNPVAVLVSKVKTTPLSKENLEEVDSICQRISSKFRSNDYSAMWIPDIPRIDHWFQKQVYRDLGLIAGELGRLAESEAKNLLEVAFSSIIVAVSNQESETRFAAVTKDLGHDAVRDLFARKVRGITERVNSLALVPAVARSSARVFLADARQISDYLPQHSIDLVVTSPPYLNSYDYYLYHKFRIYWLGFDRTIPQPDEVQKAEIGSRFEYSGTRGASVDRFRSQMKDCLAELARVTKLGKLLFVLVGDSIVRGEFVRMDALYEGICAELGLPLVAKTSYPLRDVTRSFRTQPSGVGQHPVKLQHILALQNRSNDSSCVGRSLVSRSQTDLAVQTIPREVKPGTTFLITNNKVSRYTHGMVKYPSKFIPDIPRWAIQTYSRRGDLVLDPFVGCGTTMVEARLLARNCIGLDVNPFAVLVSNVKANPIDKATLERAFRRIVRRTEEKHGVDLPKIPLRDFWFDKDVLTRLMRIREAICNEEDATRDFFLVTLGAIIKRCSYLDESQIKVERDQRKLLEGVPDPIQLFCSRATSHIEAMDAFCRDASHDSYAFAWQCDSTAIPRSLKRGRRTYSTRQADLVVTSPPYINAMNYPMFNRYELLLLNLIDYEEYVPHQRVYLGTERVYTQEYSDDRDFILDGHSFDDLNQSLQRIRALESKRAYIVKRYFQGMRKSLGELYKSLRKNGTFVFVTASNTIKGVPIPTSELLERCAEQAGFTTVTKFSYRIRKHRFKITRHKTGRQIEVDNVVVMKKE